jgi:hypothetical protein
MSDSGTKPVCLGEATVQDKIVQTWAEAKEKVTSLLDLKLYPVGVTPEQGSAMEEGRALIVEDEVTETEKRYEYWSNRQYYSICWKRYSGCDPQTCFSCNLILPFLSVLGLIFVIVFSAIFLEDVPLRIVTVVIIGCCLCLFISSEVIRAMRMYMVKKDIKAAKERARVLAEMRDVMKKAAEVTDSTCRATRLWCQAKMETLQKSLTDTNTLDTLQVHEKVIPAFFRTKDAIKAWENATLVCQQAIANMTDQSRIAEEAKRISEAVTTAEAVAREAEEMFCQAISHPTIPTHNDSTKNKSNFV